jgi:phosphate transport system substrate-binding protein
MKTFRNPENVHAPVAQYTHQVEVQSERFLWIDFDESWPMEEIKLYGPGTDSGTFDYFTESIVGEAGSSRSDYFPSEDDTTLVQGVEGDKNALGYFRFRLLPRGSQQIEGSRG